MFNVIKKLWKEKTRTNPLISKTCYSLPSLVIIQNPEASCQREQLYANQNTSSLHHSAPLKCTLLFSKCVCND